MPPVPPNERESTTSPPPVRQARPTPSTLEEINRLQDRSHSAYLSALREIDSIPVPDLASTLTPNPPPDSPASHSSEVSAQLAILERQVATQLEQQRRRIHRMSSDAALGGGRDGVRQDRLDRVLARLDSLHEAATQDAAAAAEAIADRMMAPERGGDGDDDDDDDDRIRRSARASRQLGLLPGENWQQLAMPPSGAEEHDGQGQQRMRLEQLQAQQRLAQQHRQLRRQTERAIELERLERLSRDSHLLRRSFAGSEEALRVLDEQRRLRMMLPPSSASGAGTAGPSALSRSASTTTADAAAAAAARAEARSDARARVAAAAADPTRRHARLFASRSREYFERATRDYLSGGASESSDGSGGSSSGGGAGGGQSSLSAAGLSTADGPSRPLPMIRTQSESSVATSVFMLQHAMSYLGTLRGAVAYDDGVAAARNAGFSCADVANADFVLDVHSLASPSPSSLLAPGARFAGHQYATPGPPEPGAENGASRSSAANNNNATGSSSTAATNGTAGRLPSRDPSRRSSTRARPPWAQRQNPGPTPDMAAAAAAAAVAADLAAGGASPGDDWPVKVSVFAVDYERMTLAACMEAFDVPATAAQQQPQQGPPPAGAPPPIVLPDTPTTQLVFGPAARVLRERHQRLQARLPPHLLHHQNLGAGQGRSSQPQQQTPPPREQQPRRKAITTYLEGEILDFKTHTLVTENFASTPARDAASWRRLLPFRDVPAADLAARLVDRRWLEQLSREFILMRWKERCFVAASPEDAGFVGGAVGGGAGGGSLAGVEGDGCGLTISGFYYISMRLSDGYVEGLYCDPQSSPYQFLRLERDERCGVPGWGFR